MNATETLRELSTLTSNDSFQLPFPVGSRVLVDEEGFTYAGKVLTVDGNRREIRFSNGDEGWASIADCQLAD
jgi:hypothetical protein